MKLFHCEDNRLTIEISARSMQDMNSGDIYTDFKATACFKNQHMVSSRFNAYDDAEKFAESLIKEPAMWLLLKYPVKSA